MDILEILKRSTPVRKGTGYGSIIKIEQGFSENGYVSSNAVKRFEVEGHDYLSFFDADGELYGLFLSDESGSMAEDLLNCEFFRLTPKGNGRTFTIDYPRRLPGFPPLSFEMTEKYSTESFEGRWNWDLIKLENNPS